MKRAVLLAVVGITLIPRASAAQSLPEDPDVFAGRRDALMDRLPDGIFLSHSVWELKPWAFPGQAQHPTFYYLTGMERQIGGVLALDALTGEAILFAPGGVGGFMQSMGVAVQPGEQSATDLGLDAVRPWEELKPWLDARISESPGLKLYVEGQLSGFPAVPELPPFAIPAGVFHAMLASQWPNVEVKAAWREIAELRAIKSAAEVETIRRAALTAMAGFTAGLVGIRPGRMQREVEAEIISACLAAGADGLSWWPWAHTGPAAVFPRTFEAFADYRHLNRRMQSGEVARIDVGCEVDHYHSDVGRTAPVSGSWTDGQRETWDLFVDAYRASFSVIRDGVTVDSVRETFQREVAARVEGIQTDMARRAALIMQDDEQIPSWQIHGVGLSAAEDFGPVLRTGMVVAYEPMFTVDDTGFYLEDLLVITEDGFENLTPGLPYSAKAIEAAMAGR